MFIFFSKKDIAMEKSLSGMPKEESSSDICTVINIHFLFTGQLTFHRNGD